MTSPADIASLMRRAAAELHKHAYDYNWKANTKTCALCGTDLIAGQKIHKPDCLISELKAEGHKGEAA